MFNKEKVKGFIAGACTAAIITSVGAVFATTYNIYDGDIKIVWDGVERKFYDEQGKRVKPIMINDSTYVPIRGMGAVLGKTAEYVGGENKCVYIGGKKAKETTPVEDMSKLINKSNNYYIRTGADAKYKMKNQEITAENILAVKSYVLYSLDHKYSKFTCEAVLPYEQVGSTGTGTLTFYNVANDGTKSIIDEPIELKQTEEPKKITIDISDVTNLEINYSGYSYANLTNSFFLGK